MERVQTTLLLVLLLALLGVGAVVYRADQHQRAVDRTLMCINRAQATATVALMAPSRAVDEQGRLDAIKTLGARIDAC